MKNPRFGRGWDDTANVGVGEGWGITPHPRPLHKLNLRPGDVVRLEGWQDGRLDADIGKLCTVNDDTTRARNFDLGYVFYIPSLADKGSRPLFTIVSRAPVAPEKVPDLIEREGKYPPSERNGFGIWVALFAAARLIRNPDNAQLRAEYERAIK